MIPVPAQIGQAFPVQSQDKQHEKQCDKGFQEKKARDQTRVL